MWTVLQKKKTGIEGGVPRPIRRNEKTKVEACVPIHRFLGMRSLATAAAASFAVHEMEGRGAGD